MFTNNIWLASCCWYDRIVDGQLAAGRLQLAADCRLLHGGSWLVAVGNWLLAAECRLLAHGLAAGCYLLAADCWSMTACGCWLWAAVSTLTACQVD